ncbi:MAG: DUF362 domain-containing protein [Candidatus Eisenbacteria bacterium]|nr:DUF362 domain-containing protein [Candidatus Eisenbacteria bacterium]
MDRRRFLIRSAQAIGAGILAPGLVRGAPLPEGGGTHPDLVVAQGDPREATSAALEALGGLGRFVRPNDVVAIKPNASFVAPPEWGVTTHPEVLAGVIGACLAAEARRVIVVDHTMASAERCFDRACIAPAVAGFDRAKLIALDDEKMYREIPVPRGRSLKQTALASVVTRADVLINVPTAKCHGATGVGLGLKNLMGLVWDRNTFHNDMDIHVGIADLATAVQPQLTVLDATYVLKTNGPTGPGEVDRLGKVIVGTDPVAVDAYGTGLSTWNGQTLRPAQVDYLRLAAERGVGTLDLASLRIREIA